MLTKIKYSLTNLLFLTSESGITSFKKSFNKSFKGNIWTRLMHIMQSISRRALNIECTGQCPNRRHCQCPWTWRYCCPCKENRLPIFIRGGGAHSTAGALPTEGLVISFLASIQRVVSENKLAYSERCHSRASWKLVRHSTYGVTAVNWWAVDQVCDTCNFSFV